MNIFSYLSVFFDLLANIPYTYRVIKGLIRPHPFTWLVWTILTAIMAIVQFNEGAGGGSWLLINTTFFNIIITIFAFKNGMIYADKKDYIVLGFCLACIPLYFYFNLPLYTALVITIIDSVSFIPTIRKAFKDPNGDSAIFQFLMVVAYSCSLLAMDTYTVTTCVFPIAMVIMHGITCAFLTFLAQKNKV